MTTQRNVDVSIVIPVYGSQDVLPELVSQVAAVMAENDDSFEIIFVCDQSPDDSWRVIRELSEEYDEVRGILLRINAGQHNALVAGLKQAQAPVIVTMDDDLQHSPRDIHQLLAAIATGADVAYGRFVNRNHPLWKILGSRLNNLVATQLMGKPSDLYLSPFRAFNSAIRDEIVAYSGPFVYVDGIIVSSTRSIVSVDVAHQERFAGESRYGLRKSISLWLKMATNFSIIPLRATTFIGLLTAGLGFLAAIVFIIQKFTVDVMPVGWASEIVAILLIGGLQLMGMGILGEYLGRVLLTVNGKPQYVISATVGATHKEGTDPER